MATPRAKTLAKGFVYAALTPVALACLAGTIFVGGHLGASIFAWLYGTAIALPVASATVLVFGFPIYFLYRRLRITSLFAYGVAGGVTSTGLAAVELWLEFSGGYEHANQALMEHATQLVTLISGPAAASAFWRTVRPDIGIAAPPRVPIATARPVGGSRRLWVRFAAAAGAVFILYGTFGPRHYPQSLRPLAGEEMPFDSMKAPALVSSLRDYAETHSAHLGYYFIPTHMPKELRSTMPPVLLMATLKFPDGISVIVSNPGRRGLEANIYSDTNNPSAQTDRIWSEFTAFLRPAVDHANTLSATEGPNVPWRGEGGKAKSKWWDWRFQRQ